METGSPIDTLSVESLSVKDSDVCEYVEDAGPVYEHACCTNVCEEAVECERGVCLREEAVECECERGVCLREETNACEGIVKDISILKVMERVDPEEIMDFVEKAGPKDIISMLNVIDEISTGM